MNSKTERHYVIFGNKPFALREELLGLDIHENRVIIITDRGVYSCSLETLDQYFPKRIEK